MILRTFSTTMSLAFCLFGIIAQEPEAMLDFGLALGTGLCAKHQLKHCGSLCRASGPMSSSEARSSNREGGPWCSLPTPTHCAGFPVWKCLESMVMHYSTCGFWVVTGDSACREARSMRRFAGSWLSVQRLCQLAFQPKVCARSCSPITWGMECEAPHVPHGPHGYGL